MKTMITITIDCDTKIKAQKIIKKDELLSLSGVIDSLLKEFIKSKTKGGLPNAND